MMNDTIILLYIYLVDCYWLQIKIKNNSSLNIFIKRHTMRIYSNLYII